MFIRCSLTTEDRSFSSEPVKLLVALAWKELTLLPLRSFVFTENTTVDS